MKYLIFVLIVLISCNTVNDNKVFNDVKLEGNSTEMYFFHQDYIVNQFGDDLKKPLVPEFRIIEQQVIKEIISNWEFPISQNKNQIPLYKLEVSQNLQTISSRHINDDLTSISRRGKYFEFTPESLLKYREHFIPLIKQKVRITKRDHAIEFIEIIRKNGGYLPFHNSSKLNYSFERFGGKMTIEYPDSLIPKEGSEAFNYVLSLLDFDKELIRGKIDRKRELNEEEIPNPNNNPVESFGFTLNEDAMISIELYCEKPKLLPSDFNISSDWEPLKDIEMMVYNLTPEELAALSKNNDIELIVLNSTTTNNK